MPVNVVLDNNAEDIRCIEPFQLPISPEDLRKHLNSLQFEPKSIDSISVQASLVENGGYPLVTQIDNPETILQMDELNYLAGLYDALSDTNKTKLKSVLEYIDHGFSRFPLEVGNIGDTIDIILNLDKFTFYPGVDNLYDLGVRVFNDLVSNKTEEDAEFPAPESPPFKAHAEANISNYGGCFTSGGYVAGRGEGFVPHLMLNGVPEKYRIWEKAFAELPPFENPIVIDYDELTDGSANEWTFHLAFEIFEHFLHKNHPIYTDGDDKLRSRQIIEIAELLDERSFELQDTLMDFAIDGGMYGEEASELLKKVEDLDDGLDVQLHLERSYGIDDEFEEHYREDLMKLPPDLQYDEYLKCMLENRKRHQQTIKSLENQPPPLDALTPEQRARFDMLPADKQAQLVQEQDTYTQYCRVKLRNARSMVGLYSELISEYQEEHAKNGPYDPEKMQRATELKQRIKALVESVYKCEPELQPVVTIEAHGCSLFPIGKRFPFPVFNDIFSMAVEHFGLLHEAGVPVSQNLLYLNMEFRMAGKHEHIHPHSDKSALLFVDQGKSFLQQVVETPDLEPGYREMLAAYLTMHLGVDKHFQEEMKAVPAKMEKYFQQQTEQTVGKHFGTPFGPLQFPTFYNDAFVSAEDSFNQINFMKDYEGRLPSEPIPKGDVKAIARRFNRIVDTLDPCGDESYERFTPAEVAEAISNGDMALVNGYIEKLQSIEGIYESAAFNLAVAIEEVFPEQDMGQRKESIAPEQATKPSILEELQKFKPGVMGTDPPSIDKEKDTQR